MESAMESNGVSEKRPTNIAQWIVRPAKTLSLASPLPDCEHTPSEVHAQSSGLQALCFRLTKCAS